MKPREIKSIRKALGLSQQALSNLLGVALGTVNRWEAGTNKPSHLAAYKLKELLDKMNKGKE